jgi:hypothetical protein
LEPGLEENQQLVIGKPVEFEIYLVEIGDCMRITDHFIRGIYRRTYPKQNQRMSLGDVKVPPTNL